MHCRARSDVFPSKNKTKWPHPTGNLSPAAQLEIPGESLFNGVLKSSVDFVFDYVCRAFNSEYNDVLIDLQMPKIRLKKY